MLQNRVDPLGNIIRTEARGAWMGNRGVLHGDQQKILRPFKGNAWLTCKLTFKGRKRPVLMRGKYTELFFLDEATAFAAGHRPCAECRRDDFTKFKSLWLTGNPAYHFHQKTSIQLIDAILQQERIDDDGSKKTFEEDCNNLPNGVFVMMDDKPYLLYNGSAFLWSPFGYIACVHIPPKYRLTVLTPGSIVTTFRAGYVPQVSPSVNNFCHLI